jgi:hypothetical protein
MSTLCPEYTEFENEVDGIVNLYCDGDVDPVTGRHVDGDSRHRAATSTHPDHVFYWGSSSPEAETMQKAVLDIFAEVMPRLRNSSPEQWAKYGCWWLDGIHNRIAALDPAAVTSTGKGG